MSVGSPTLRAPACACDLPWWYLELPSGERVWIKSGELLPGFYDFKLLAIAWKVK